jgi:hypothetical protein
MNRHAFCPVCWPHLFDAQASTVPLASPCDVHADHPISRIWKCLTFGLVGGERETRGAITPVNRRDPVAGESGFIFHHGDTECTEKEGGGNG